MLGSPSVLRWMFGGGPNLWWWGWFASHVGRGEIRIPPSLTECQKNKSPPGWSVGFVKYPGQIGFSFRKITVLILVFLCKKKPCPPPPPSGFPANLDCLWFYRIFHSLDFFLFFFAAIDSVNFLCHIAGFVRRSILMWNYEETKI